MKRFFALVVVLLLAIPAEAQVQVITPARGFTNDYAGTGYTVSTLSATSATVMTPNTILAQTVMCVNVTGGAVTVTGTDTAGNVVIPTVSIAANAAPVFFVNALAGVRLVGLKMWASAALSINCIITGKQ